MKDLATKLDLRRALFVQTIVVGMMLVAMVGALAAALKP